MVFWDNLLRLLPFAWSRHPFMNYAVLAVFLVTLIFGMIGTMVVNNRMAFYFYRQFKTKNITNIFEIVTLVLKRNRK